MAVVMEVTESHTLIEYDDWLQVMTAMFCVVPVHIDSVNPSSPGTVIFLVKGVGCALQWARLLLTYCLNALITYALLCDLVPSG